VNGELRSQGLPFAPRPEPMAAVLSQFTIYYSLFRIVLFP
jgi:hypothetical protein